MAELPAAVFGVLHREAHRCAVVAMKRVPFDDLRIQLFAPEDVLETLHNGGGAGSARTGDRHDRVFDRHGESLI